MYKPAVSHEAHGIAAQRVRNDLQRRLSIIASFPSHWWQTERWNLGPKTASSIVQK